MKQNLLEEVERSTSRIPEWAVSNRVRQHSRIASVQVDVLRGIKPTTYFVKTSRQVYKMLLADVKPAYVLTLNS
jgi:hypothetical protein